MLKDKELEIINHYGVMNQLKYFQSEIFELNEAIISYELNDSNSYEIPLCELAYGYDHIVEEIADVQMMLNQFKRYYEIEDEEIEKVMNYKADRQLERIKNERV